jgi:DNA polymerase I-like protein with 3'-5' exonuclease and polymerase domains
MLFSLDIETTGLNYFKDQILCIGVCDSDRNYQVFQTVEAFNEWNRPDEYFFFCHNGAFDVSFLRHHGSDIRSQFLYDTRSIATILIPTPSIAPGQKSPFGLENLYQVLLKGKSYKLDRKRMSDVPWKDLIAYNEKDCRITYDLIDFLSKNLDERDWAFVESWIMPATKLLMEMSYNGVWIHRERLASYQEKVEGELHEVEKELQETTQEAQQVFQALEVAKLRKAYDHLCAQAELKARDPALCRQRYNLLFEKARQKLAPFNFNSSSQLKWLLKDFYGLNLFNERSQKETTDEAMLKEHASSAPVCQVLVKHRELQKLTSTCIPAIRDHIAPDGRVHPRFIVGGTRTGRLSSSEPNFQQVPRGPLRSCVMASEGHSFFIADYAQIEVRILAELAKEKELIDAFKEGIDCYSIIAKKLLSLDCPVHELKKRHPRERDVSKTAGLSIFYGTGAGKLREVLSKELGLNRSLKDCRDFIENYRKGFAAIEAYKKQVEQALANQKKIHGLLGRPLYIHSNDDLYMKALNTVVQGSASDLVVEAFGSICRAFPFIKPVLIVHDEMVMEIPDAKLNEALLQEMETLATAALEKKFNLEVPLKIEWHVAKEWLKP